jgi:hypothetical protein
MRNAEAEEATENAVQMMTNERGSGVPAFGMEVRDGTSSTHEISSLAPRFKSMGMVRKGNDKSNSKWNERRQVRHY